MTRGKRERLSVKKRKKGRKPIVLTFHKLRNGTPLPKKGNKQKSSQYDGNLSSPKTGCLHLNKSRYGMLLMKE